MFYACFLAYCFPSALLAAPQPSPHLRIRLRGADIINSTLRIVGPNLLAGMQPLGKITRRVRVAPFGQITGE
ncbi:hypothetical protein D3C86_1912990 [compost metagenome]